MSKPSDETPPIKPPVPPRRAPEPKYANYKDIDEDYPRSISGVYKVVDDQWSRVSKILVLVGVVGGGILAVGGIASAQTDAGLKVVKDRQENMFTDIKIQKEENAAKFAQQERRGDRQDEKQEVMNKKIDLLLDAARVPLYKRPDEVDSGPVKRDGGR